MKVCLADRMTASIPEDKLIQAAQAGDADAFGLLYERYKNTVYSYIAGWVGRGSDADDVMQETFCRAWRGICGFRRESRFSTWLYRIATNECAQFRRQAGRTSRLGVRVDLEDDELFSGSAPAIDPESQVLNRQTLDDALSRIKPFQRALVMLCEVQGFTCREAAEVMQCSAASVRVGLFHARRRLRTLLAPALEEGE